MLAARFRSKANAERAVWLFIITESEVQMLRAGYRRRVDVVEEGKTLTSLYFVWEDENGKLNIDEEDEADRDLTVIPVSQKLIDFIKENEFAEGEVAEVQTLMMLARDDEHARELARPLVPDPLLN